MRLEVKHLLNDLTNTLTKMGTSDPERAPNYIGMKKLREHLRKNFASDGDVDDIWLSDTEIDLISLTINLDFAILSYDEVISDEFDKFIDAVSIVVVKSLVAHRNIFPELKFSDVIHKVCGDISIKLELE
jgi:hypothetical protein